MNTRSIVRLTGFAALWLLSTLLCSTANAQSCSLAATNNLAFGTQTVSLPRDATTGALIATRTINYVATCSGLRTGLKFGIKFHPDAANCPAGGNPNYLSTNTIRNIGLNLAKTPVPNGGTGASGICSTSSTSASGRFFDVVLSTVTSTTQSFAFSITAEVIKTDGALQTGSSSFSGNIGYLDWVLLGVTNSQNFTTSSQVSASVTANVSALTCSTPNVAVRLGTHKRTEFTGINSTSTEKPFAIQLNNCPNEIQDIGVRFRAVTASLGNGVITLNTGSTATGIAIKLTDGNANDMPKLFNAEWKIPNFIKGQTNYTFPMRAAYIQTAANINPGSANSSLIFIMNYR